MQTSRTPGFTLIETLVVLTITAILLGIGVPSFRWFTASRSIQAASTDLANSIKLARSESVKRGVRVSLCPSVDGAGCAPDAAPQDWSIGWIVFTDRGVRGAVEPGDQVLRVQQAIAGGNGILASGNASYVLSLLPSGIAVNAQNSFRFPPPEGLPSDSSVARVMCIASTGATRVVQGQKC